MGASLGFWSEAFLEKSVAKETRLKDSEGGYERSQ